MSGLMNQFLQQLGEGDQIHDWAHASKIFVNSNYRLSPKLQTLFHVYIELNPIATQDSQNPNSRYETGLLAKSASLPKFTVQNKVLNSYNRKSIIQEKLTYDPVTITFHDDSADVIRNFWQNYYHYYYRDSDHSSALYNQPYKYSPRTEQNWGFTPSTSSNEPYINAITIYSLHQKTFSAYRLVRPTITAFQHGQHTAGSYEAMEHSMTIAYETVQYSSGPVNSNTVAGFAGAQYDHSASPLTSLGGGTQSILGPGGLVESAGDAITNIENGNYGAALLGGLRTFNNFKNADLKTVASADLAQTGLNILKGQNTQSSVFVPTIASVQDGVSRATTSTPSVFGSSARNGGILNMNSASSQIPSTNQGIAGTILNLL